MTELEAINICLVEGAGVAPASSKAGNNALRALSLLDSARKTLLREPYPFNTDLIDLIPNDDGEILLPDTYLSIELADPYIVRDGKVYNPDTRSYQPGQSFLQVKVALYLGFEQLEHAVALAIAWSACKSFTASIRGAGSTQFAYASQQAVMYNTGLSGEYPVDIETETYNCSVRWCSCG